MMNALNKLFCVIILNWNAYENTKVAIESVLMQNYPNKIIIVVDNNSRDHSLERLRSEYRGLVFIRTERNLGYTGGNNIGIRRALELGADYVMVLNNDTILKAKEFLTNIGSLFCLSRDIGVVGPVILDRETLKRLDCYKNSFFLNLLESHVNNCRSPIIDSKLLDVNRVSGCAVVFSRDVLEKCGGFDESFFMYCEEMDLCYRAKQCGKYVVKVEDESLAAVMRMNEPKWEKGYVWYYITRNLFYLIQKHHNGTKKLLLYCLNVLSMLRRSKNIIMLKFGILGAIDFIRKKKGVLRSDNI